MDLRHLDLLRELRDRGTLTAVAAATHRSPSAVSQHLRAAERALGVRLVEPDGRRLRLTAAGLLLAEGAVEVATAVARVSAGLDGLRGRPEGAVRVGSLPSAAEALLPEVVAALRGTAVTMELDDFDLAESDYPAQAADYDIVIGHSAVGPVPAGAQGLRCTTLARERLDIAVPADHPLAARAELSPADLGGQPWLSVPEGYPFDTIRQAVEAASGVPTPPVARLRDNRFVEALVVAGVGVAVLPRFTTRPRQGLVTRPLVGVPCERYLVALSRPDRAERAAVRLVLQRLEDAGRRAQERHGPAPAP